MGRPADDTAGMSLAERSRAVAAVFDRAATTYEAVGVPWFAPIAQRLVRELAPSPGERALDIGCGRGAALFPLAEAVGPTGAVTGIDLSAGMVQATQDDVLARGWTHVRLHVMDAMSPGLPDGTFDLAASSLVLFFLPDPVAALTAWRRLLAEGGRLGVSTFAERDPLWVTLDDVFRPYLPPMLLDARTRGESGPFASDQGVEGLLRDAGFGGVRTVSDDVAVTFDDPEHWHTWSWSHGQRAMWESVPEPDRATVRDAAFAVLADARSADGRITLRQQVRYTLADRDPR